jgi:cytidylate kinase
VLYLIGGPSRVGKSTLAQRLHEAVGASLVTTDAIVWMLQVAAPQLGVSHGTPTKPIDTLPYVLPFVEAATVYGSRDLILEGDAIGPSTVTELLSRWRGRAVILGASGMTATECRARGGYVSELADDEVDELVRHIRERSAVERAACAELEIRHVDVDDLAVAARDAWSALVG